jgi:hypothetical protein
MALISASCEQFLSYFLMQNYHFLNILSILQFIIMANYHQHKQYGNSYSFGVKVIENIIYAYF